MVGGAISGYWAIGSVESAITPTSVMTMLMTPAKIGRSIKKCGKFTGLRNAKCEMRNQRTSWECGVRNAELETRLRRAVLIEATVIAISSFASCLIAMS